MEGDGEIAYDPERDGFSPTITCALGTLFDYELLLMATKPFSQDKEYKRFCISAVAFIEKQSKDVISDALIPYMAMTYVDQFISTSKIPYVVDPAVKNIKLFLISCLTIAWKLRNESFKLSYFLNQRNLEYSEQNVCDLQMHIYRHLGWLMGNLTPFSFLDVFFPMLELETDVPFPYRSICKLIVKAKFDILFIEIRPSVLAVFAIRTVCKKKFPHKYALFELKLALSIFSDAQLEMLSKCNKMLEPLYKGPPMQAEPKQTLGEASSSAVRKRSSPVPVPWWRTSSAAKTNQITMIELPGNLVLDSSPTASNIEEERRSYASEKQAYKDQRIHHLEKKPAVEEKCLSHEGKKPASTEIHPKLEESAQLVQAESKELKGIFELG